MIEKKIEEITKAELNKCKTIEEKMEWLGKVLGQAIFNNDMNYAVWVNIQKNNIIDQLEKDNAEQKVQIEKMKCCENCKHNIIGKCAELYCQECSYYGVPNQNIDKWELKNE